MRVSRADANSLKLFKHYINKFTTATQKDIEAAEMQSDEAGNPKDIVTTKKLLNAVLRGVDFESYIAEVAIDMVRTGEYFRLAKNANGDYVLHTNGQECVLDASATEGESEFKAKMGYFDLLSKQGTEVRFSNKAGLKFVLIMYGFDNIKGNIVSLKYENKQEEVDLDIFCQFDGEEQILMTYMMDGAVVAQRKYDLTTRDTQMIMNTRLNNDYSI